MLYFKATFTLHHQFTVWFHVFYSNFSPCISTNEKHQEQDFQQDWICRFEKDTNGSNPWRAWSGTRSWFIIQICKYIYMYWHAAYVVYCILMKNLTCQLVVFEYHNSFYLLISYNGMLRKVLWYKSGVCPVFLFTDNIDIASLDTCELVDFIVIWCQ